MKLQHVSVLFVLIFIPIILVTTYFIKLQVNTIKLESSYDDKLLNATYDAMTSFELNTANEDLSTVSDSLRSIIDASNNIFFNTLCTNLGVSNASKSYVQPYIPAILYTLYDGYYIYSPTNIPEICVDKYGRTIRTSDYGVTFITKQNGIGIYSFNKDSIVYSKFNATEPAENPAAPGDDLQTAPSVNYSDLKSNHIEEEYGQILYKNNDGTYSASLHTISGNPNRSTYYKRDYILKSYIPYSARYSNSNMDIAINYTLDNFITLEGKIDGVYYTKSGYFIDKDLVNEIVVNKLRNNGTIEWTKTINSANWTEITEEMVNEYINNPEGYEVSVKLVEQKDNDGNPTKTIVISNQDGRVRVPSESGTGTEIKYWDDAKSAVEYYVDSFIFSSWVHENLAGIEAKNLKNTQYSVSDIQNNITQNIDKQTDLYKDMLYNFSGDSSKPFEETNNNPDSEESIFYKHKRNVIKNSITYNLILSMLVYTEESRTVEYSMPVFDENEWDRILNNVSITSFMQGMRCGLKYYNNYAIVTSTNNEISVDENEIYYVPRARPVPGKTDQFYLNYIDDNEALDTKYKIAHRIDCEELDLSDGFGAISFKSKEIKYDKILDSSGKYIYDHRVYTDYDCIVDSNYTVKNISGSKFDGNTDVLKYLQDNSNSGGTDLEKNLYYKLCAYRIAIAKERNNLYKTTAFPENYGWENIYLGDLSTGQKTINGTKTIDISSLSRNNLKDIKKIEVTIEGVEQKNLGVYTTDVTAQYNDGSTYGTKQTISTTSKSRRTIEFSQDFGDSTVNSITLSAPNIEFTIEEIKFYYK